MRLRAPTPSERVIIKAFFEELDAAKKYNEDPMRDSVRGRNMIYALTAGRCGVEYNRVVELCHDKLYLEKYQGVWFHGWQTGEV